MTVNVMLRRCYRDFVDKDIALIKTVSIKNVTLFKCGV